MDPDFAQSFASHSLNVVIIVAGGMLTFFFGKMLLARLVSRIVKSVPQHRHWPAKDVERRQNTLSALFSSLWRLAVIVVVAITIYREIFPEIDLTPLFASIGIIGITLGVALQSVIKDFLSGVFIISEDQYRIGDVIEIDGNSGTVERIGSRSTVVRDDDGNMHYFPNSTVQHVVNKTGYGMGRFTIVLDPSADIEQVIKLINETGRKLADEEKWADKIINPPAFASIGAFTSTGVSVLVTGKTKTADQWAVAVEMRRRVLKELEKAKIKLA